MTSIPMGSIVRVVDSGKVGKVTGTIQQKVKGHVVRGYYVRHDTVPAWTHSTLYNASELEVIVWEGQHGW